MNVNDSLCPVCLADFDNNEVIPKVLKCGHSLCSNCLSNIFRSNADTLCPTCRGNITNKESFPTNFALLNLLSECEKKLGMQKEVETGIASLKIEVTEELGNSFRRTKFLESTLSRVVELEKYEEENISVKRALHNIGEIRKDLTRDAVQPESSDTLNITDFPDKTEYLYEVYRKMKTGRPVFTIHTLGKENKYGEVTLLGNKIFVHCLSSFIEMPRNATFVWFQDLKSCWLYLEFGAFLQIPCNAEGLEELLEIQLKKEHPSLNQYTKLCTGEIGPSYKGAPYRKPNRSSPKISNFHSILIVPQYICDGNLKTGRIDYVGGKRVPHHIMAGEISVWIGDNLEFVIVQAVAQENDNNIIGKVVNRANLANTVFFSFEAPMKIADCGVYFHLE